MDKIKTEQFLEEWEKEYAVLMVERPSQGINFIRSLVKQTREDTLKQVLPKQEKLKKQYSFFNNGFNFCIDKIKSQAKKKWGIKL